MTETAQMADIVLPATMFMEHDDLYHGGGHQHISVGAKLIEPPGECRSNHEVLRVWPAPRRRASRLRHDAARADRLDAAEERPWRHRDAGGRSVARPAAGFRTSHYLNGFAHPDGKFRFKADWAHVPFGDRRADGALGADAALPDHWDVIEEADEAHPFRLATSPARNFLNSTFNETPTSRAREGAPDGDDPSRWMRLARHRRRRRGRARQCRGARRRLTAKLFDGLRRGVLIAESIWPNEAHSAAAASTC